MSNKVSELRNNLTEKLIKMSFDSKLIENPSFSSMISQFIGVIISMNLGEKANDVLVTQEDEMVNFKYDGENSSYKITISVLSNNSFKYFLEEEKKPWRAIDGKYVREKIISEGIAEVNENGNSTLQANYGYLNDFNCSERDCNVSDAARRIVYDVNGIEIERSYLAHDTYKQIFSIDDLPYSSILNNARQAFNIGSFASNNYSYREIVRRDKFDTARISIDDKSQNKKYSSIVQLNGEHGYQSMFVAGNSYGPRTIMNLSECQIEDILSREKNEKVRAGLMEYAQGRDVYFYSSNEDPYYVSEGYGEESKSK